MTNGYESISRDELQLMQQLFDEQYPHGLKTEISQEALPQYVWYLEAMRLSVVGDRPVETGSWQVTCRTVHFAEITSAMVYGCTKLSVADYMAGIPKDTELYEYTKLTADTYFARNRYVEMFLTANMHHIDPTEDQTELAEVLFGVTMWQFEQGARRSKLMAYAAQYGIELTDDPK